MVEVPDIILPLVVVLVGIDVACVKIDNATQDGIKVEDDEIVKAVSG